MDKETPRNKQLEAMRIGPCVALTCSRNCEEFLRAGYDDGFIVCVCGHTQWAHEVRIEA